MKGLALGLNSLALGLRVDFLTAAAGDAASERGSLVSSFVAVTGAGGCGRYSVIRGSCLVVRIR